MIILGVDCGFAITGWGVVEKIDRKNSVKYVAHGTIQTEKTLPLEERLNQLYIQLEKIIKKYKPEYVCVEQIFFFKNQKTVIQVAEARGVIILCVRKNEIQLRELTPLQVKQAVTSNGRADKTQVQKMVKVLLNMKEIVRPDDAADALAIAIAQSFWIKH